MTDQSEVTMAGMESTAATMHYSIPVSEWDYRTIKELTDALQARKVSASELLEHTIARIEALDRHLNAVVVRDFERAREAARAADIDSHPLMPTDGAVHSAICRLSERLAEVGVKVAHTSELLPNLADSARLYMRLLASAKSASLPSDRYEETQRSAAALTPDDDGLAAQRTRGTVLSHRDWLSANVARTRLQQQWSLFFREWDIVLYPPAPVPAFLYRSRRATLRSTAKGAHFTMPCLCGRILPQLAASPRPLRLSIVRRPICRLGCRSSGHI